MPRFRSDDDDTYRQAMRDQLDPFDELPADDEDGDIDDNLDDEDDDEDLELRF